MTAFNAMAHALTALDPQSVRTTHVRNVTNHLHVLRLEHFGWTADVECHYWTDDDGHIEVAIDRITLRSADCSRWMPAPLTMFTEDALSEIRDEIEGELEQGELL